MTPTIHDLTFPTAIDHNSGRAIWAIHNGGWYITNLDPMTASEFCREHLNQILWFQFDIPNHLEIARNILSANPGFHLVTLQTVLKQNI